MSDTEDTTSTSEDSSDENIKVCLVCEGGGHFVQMSLLEEAFHGFDYFYVTINNTVTCDRPNTYLFKGIDFTSPTGYIRAPMYYLFVFIKALRLLLKENPAVMVSTGGSEVAIPVCYAGKALGKKLIFIEAPTRVNKPSLSGKLLAPISDKVFVRNPELLEVYGTKAEFHGRAV